MIIYTGNFGFYYIAFFSILALLSARTAAIEEAIPVFYVIFSAYFMIRWNTVQFLPFAR